MWGPGAAGELVDPVALAHQLLADDPAAALTVSGGEPTEQAAAVARLLAAARALGRTTWVYSGRTLEELLAAQDPDVLEMLAYVDVLVDGRFEESTAAALMYRGSANQRILRLTETIPASDAERGPGGRLGVTIDSTGTMVVIGIPPPGFLPQFQARLRERGVIISPQQPWR
jgi:anaerobic ribonucleoside-triphosphate reductase activating protein